VKMLVTGAAGFIGHHVVEHFLRSTDWELILVDKLGYASNGMSRLRDIRVFEQVKNRVGMWALDVSRPISYGVEKEIGSVDVILHMAAETHVDRSITDPKPFVESNVLGTMEMLEYAKRLNSKLKMFIYFSTDEVFGPCFNGAPPFKEWSRYNSTNPYSATKAAAEELCMAWANTYGIPMVVTHCMNAFGERQHPEKFVPACVRKILKNELITIHADATKTQAGARSYIHARNAAAAIQFLIENVKAGAGQKLRDKYNIVGEKEVDNESLVKMIHKIMLDVMGYKQELRYELVDFHSSRPGHDLRYALDGRKLAELGWEPPKNFEASLEKTVRWMLAPENLNWLMLD
jgi:dTDP-glucose 4,6-dehydratase